MLVMDLPLWEPSDDQGHVMPFHGGDYAVDSWLFDSYSDYGAVDVQSRFCLGDNWLTDFYYGHDVIEEDALNEKYCMQVLQILMDKTDKEIVKLEDDIVMLQCQLAWDEEEWSKTCSAALREKINHLNDLVHSLKIENMEDAHCFFDELEQLEKVPPGIHDILKPLLENYSSAKVEQHEQKKNNMMPVVSAAGISEPNLEAMISEYDKKLVVQECINMQEHDKTTSLPLESEDVKIKNSRQANDATTLKCISDAHKCAYYKLFENDLNELNSLQKKRMPISAPATSGWKRFRKLELSNPVIKNSSTSVSIHEDSLKERSNNCNDEEGVFPLEKNSQCSPQEASTVTNSHLESQQTEKGIMKTVKPADVILDTRLECGKQIVEASSQTEKVRTNHCVIGENVVFTKPLVSLKRKRKKSAERTEELKARSIKDTNPGSLELINGIMKCTGKPKINTDTIIKLQQIPERKNLVSSHAKPTCSVKRENQSPEENYLATSEIVVQLFLEKDADTGSSSTRKVNRQQQKKFTKSGNVKSEQELGLADIEVQSEDTSALISSLQKKRKKSSLSLPNITAKKGARDFLMKIARADDDTPTNGAQAPKDFEDGGTLSLSDLRAIAKKQQLRGYHKLRKAELQELLGLNPEENAYVKKGQDRAYFQKKQLEKKESKVKVMANG